jgi:hypothetical protein
MFFIYLANFSTKNEGHYLIYQFWKNVLQQKSQLLCWHGQPQFNMELLQEHSKQCLHSYMTNNIAIGIPWSIPNIFWILIIKQPFDIEDLTIADWMWLRINAFKIKRNPPNKRAMGMVCTKASKNN